MSTPTARRRSLARPTAEQRAGVQAILADCPELADGAELVVVYVSERAAEAAWLTAQARASGVTVRLAAVPEQVRAVRDRTDREVEAGATVVVLADMVVDLPPAAAVLAGTEHISPIDFWRSRAVLDEAADALVRTLGPALTVDTAGHRLYGAVTGVVPGRPPGTVEATVDGAGGTFVADGAIAVNRPVRWDARLAGRAVRVTVEQGAVTAVECPDPALDAFLRRAVHAHRADRVTAVRFGVHPVRCAYSATAGRVNACRPGTTLRLTVDPQRAYSPASADLCIDLTAATEVADHGPDA